MTDVRADILEALEERLEAAAGDDPTESLAVLASLAGMAIDLDEDELRGAGRRALLLLATGGDPLRQLDLDSRAVAAFAGDLDSPSRRAELAIGLTELASEAGPFPRVTAALLPLLDDDELAWRAYATGTLAELLLGDED